MFNFNLTRCAAVIAAALLAVQAPQQAEAQTAQVPVDGSFQPGEIRFAGELGTVYEYRWAARPIDGMIAICGVGYTRDPRLRQTLRQMMRNGEMRLNGQQLVPVDLRHFGRARSAAALNGATAVCSSTGVSGQGIRSVEMRFGNGMWRN